MRMRAKNGIRRRCLYGGLGFAASFLLLAQILFGTAPKAVIYFFADYLAAPILNETKAPDAPPVKVGKRLAALWLEQNILSQVYGVQRVNLQEDAIQIGMRLVALRSTLLNQLELPHDVPEGPVEMAGFGWCEGLNGIAAILLSHAFDHAELVSLKGPSPVAGDGHVFGRVWSRQHKDWLYFDMWSGEVVVFQNKLGRQPNYLFRQTPKGMSRPDVLRAKTLEWFYDRAAFAVRQNELQPTLGGYLWNRTWHYLDHGFTGPKSAEALINAPVSSPLSIAQGAGKYERKSTVPRTYMRARLDALFGKTASARSAYAAVVKSDAALNSIYGKAAAVFMQRIDAQAKPD